MTTRLLQVAKSVQNFEIKELDEASALNLLRAIVVDGRIDRDLETAKRICNWLGYLPLGLELVGQYLASDADVELSDDDEGCLGLWQRLQNARLDARFLRQSDPGMTASESVTAAFELSWQQLDEEEQGLAALLSLFAAAEIPWKQVQACLPSINPQNLEVLRNRKLLGLHLLQRTGKGMYQLHSLLREFFAVKRAQMPNDEAMKRSFCAVMVKIGQQILQPVTLETIVRFTPAIPHLKEVATTLSPWLTNGDLIYPSTRIAWFYAGQLALGEAEEWYLHCRASVTQRLGQDHPDVALSLNNLAVLYRSQGRYGEAESLHLKALEIWQRQLGADHPHLSTSLNNLAEVYCSQGRYGEAEPLHLKALEIWQRQLGADHPDVALSLNNLAMLYETQGRYGEAEPLHVKALEIRQRQLRADHPDVAQSLNNLAEVYRVQGRYGEAKPLHVRALAIRQRQLGDNHPDVAQSLNNLALVYKSQGQYREVEPCYLQAISIFNLRLGETHPNTQTVVENFREFLQQVIQSDRTAELSDDPRTRSVLQELREKSGE